jgi:hypothetical protein
MEREDVCTRVNAALKKLVDTDAHLFTHDLGERCISSRLAMYLQHEFPGYSADAEYNRAGAIPKRLHLPEECANYRNEEGESLVVPDVIVHTRGPEGPNVLVLEVKKTSNPCPRDCDRARIHAFRSYLGYEFAALIECETRIGRHPAAYVVEWLGG